MTKIAASSASLPVLTILQNHRCSTLGKGQRDGPEVKVINKEQQVTEVCCKLYKMHSKGGGVSLSLCAAQLKRQCWAWFLLLFLFHD